MGRLYLVYTDEPSGNDTEIFLLHSNDNGASWNPTGSGGLAPVRVNNDSTARSQFLPRIAVDQTTGNVAVGWYDCRNDAGTPGNPDEPGNIKAQFYFAVSTNGGQSFQPNVLVGSGQSDRRRNGVGTSDGSFDYGDYSGLAYHGGIAFPISADNSNSLGTNPVETPGNLNRFNIHTRKVFAP